MGNQRRRRLSLTFTLHMLIYINIMQSVTRFVSRVLPSLSKRPSLLRSVNSVHRSSVQASRCICACKLFHKLPTNVHNTSFSRHIETDSSSDENENQTEKKDGPIYIHLKNLSFATTEEDIKEFFGEENMVDEPIIIRFKQGLHSGSAFLRVAEEEPFISKNGEMFNNRNLTVMRETEEYANAMIGLTTIKVLGIPYEWTKADMLEYFYSQGVAHPMVMVIPPSSVLYHKCAGRVYLAFHDEESKMEAAKILDGATVDERTLTVVESISLFEGYVDRSRAMKKAD